MKKPVFLLIAWLLTHCVSSSAPIKDFTIAETAFKRAKKAGSEKYSGKNFSQAKKLYRQAVSFYRQEEYSQARDYFQKSILLFEKAEETSLYRQKKEQE